ncbi:3-deoxy-D-manno-octulosonic acid transferase [Nitrospinaceae bacterium]|nr:3-deoxy-D-manno-octulosonic acid transferase [Nitrospinaceae bacterium]
MIFFYHVFSVFAILVVVPCFALYSLFSRNKWRRLNDHFGLVSSSDKTENTQKTIWFHALSLGEVVGVTPTIRLLKKSRPQDRIVISVTTDSGFEAAKRKLSDVDSIFFFPLDCFVFTWTALKKIKPDLFVLVETGFWPGFIHILHLKGVPALLFNGRISSRSIRKYKIFSPFFSKHFNRFTMLCMQNPHSKNKLESLGIEKSRLMVVGDPKFDTLPNPSQEKRTKVRQKLCIAPLSMVWVAGSTHEGEEEIILDVHARLREQFGNLILVLAPRRLERCMHVTRIILSKRISFMRRSEQLDKSDHDFSVLLLDTMGELAEVYSICDVAFVGRSLMAPGGGHNLIEPVAQGKPVLFGPFVENNQHNADELIKSGLGIRINNANEMEESVKNWLSNKIELAKLEGKAKGFILHHQGASRRMANFIETQLVELKTIN